MLGLDERKAKLSWNEEDGSCECDLGPECQSAKDIRAESAGCGLQFEVKYGKEQVMVLAQEQTMVDFEMVLDCYCKKIAQPIPDLLHSLMDLGYLCLPKERRAHKGLSWSKVLCLRETEREKKGLVSLSCWLKKMLLASLLKAQSLQLLVQ